jgi:hypothetical protein
MSCKLESDIGPQPFEASLFRELYRERAFVDRGLGRNDGVDVIIPLLHSTDLWVENLKSFYREIPINRLLVGNAGAIDGSPAALSAFPRVELLDHTDVKTLGKSLAELISRVETESFIYLASDVYLPPGWYDTMLPNSQSFDWFGCPMQIVVMMDYPLDYSGSRPLVGAQMGRTDAFEGINDFVDDDFIYRNEEFVLDQYIRNRGRRSGATHETYFFHQQTRRRTLGFELAVTDVELHIVPQPSEQDRVLQTQAYGLIKYCNPTDQQTINATVGALNNLVASKTVDKQEVVYFARQHNPAWTPYVRSAFSWRMAVRRNLGVVVRAFYRRFASHD